MIGRVRLDCQTESSLRLDLLNRGGRMIRCGNVGDGNIGTILCQSFSNRRPDTSRAAENQGGLACQILWSDNVRLCHGSLKECSVAIRVKDALHGAALAVVKQSARAVSVDRTDVSEICREWAVACCSMYGRCVDILRYKKYTD